MTNPTFQLLTFKNVDVEFKNILIALDRIIGEPTAVIDPVNNSN